MSSSEPPMDSLWDTLIRRYGMPCAQAREELMRARTAHEVVRMLAPPPPSQPQQVPPPDLPPQPFTAADGLLRGLGAAIIEAIHRHAIACLQVAAPGDFDRLLHWHRRHNLEPCRDMYPDQYIDFEMKLQRIACTRWLLEMRHESQSLH